tara:strand:- start:177 stop:548 length:372 start_codon:yes stop_codon:yes gene_type:complete
MKDCNQCGKCCVKYGGNGGLSANAEEINWWQDHRPEIAQYVQQGNIWIDPTTGDYLSTCPWLNKLPDEEKYTCDIYFDRPEDCRDYPSLVSEMIRDGCEMIEVQDLSNPDAAQKRLNRLMDRS